jgi:hypothetical protein
MCKEQWQLFFSVPLSDINNVVYKMFFLGEVE